MLVSTWVARDAMEGIANRVDGYGKSNGENIMNNKNILSVLIGALIGGLAGAITMLLFAPQSGEKTRIQIQEKGIELRDLATEMVDDTWSQVRESGEKFTKSGSQKAKELMQQGH